MFQNERREKMNKGKKLGEAGRVMRISWPLVTKITGDFRFVFFLCFFVRRSIFFFRALFVIARKKNSFLALVDSTLECKWREAVFRVD